MTDQANDATLPRGVSVKEMKLHKISYIAGGTGTAKDPIRMGHQYFTENGTEMVPKRSGEVP